MDTIDRKEFLFKLVSELYNAVDYLYGDDKLSEALKWFGIMLSKISLVISSTSNEYILDEFFKLMSEELELKSKLWSSP